MFFTEEFLDSIRSDPLASVIQICNDTLAAVAQLNRHEWDDEQLDILLEALALINAIEEQELLAIGLSKPNTNEIQDRVCSNIFQYLEQVRDAKEQDRAAVTLSAKQKRFATALGNGFAYEFSKPDISRVQQLISELRESIAKSELFDENHRSRLLSRLEKLQAELHKRVSDLDRFWGLIGDAGVVLGKFGEDAKPFVDRIKEVAQIVWNTQARSENLPSNTTLPLLSDDSAGSHLGHQASNDPG
ncbi:hypothetical protein ACN9MZ_27345 [Pseudoduganella sp. S-14]|uniref:hypothetical protein n=1 Tax=Pseudoduganella sp. S-14 TaxID=3404065 RepID=UPI003CF3717B